MFLFVFCEFGSVSPEFSYRPGLSVLSEDSAAPVPSHGSGGPPNRPLPPTPDDDDQNQGDRTLIMKRVSVNFFLFISICFLVLSVSPCLGKICVSCANYHKIMSIYLVRHVSIYICFTAQ